MSKLCLDYFDKYSIRLPRLKRHQLNSLNNKKVLRPKKFFYVQVTFLSPLYHLFTL